MTGGTLIRNRDRWIFLKSHNPFGLFLICSTAPLDAEQFYRSELDSKGQGLAVATSAFIWWCGSMATTFP